ncbi:MAG: VWA domain-containing protein [Bacteroidales bacterium]|nr:VWA domain-containing protein [Bacteroidales bacterium]
MKKAFLYLIALASAFSCSKADFGGAFSFPDGAYSKTESGWGGGQGGYHGGQAGVLTAGEWNDLDHWDFWSGLMVSNNYKGMSDYWGFYTSRRVAVRVADADGKRLPGVRVTLEQGQNTIWSVLTDNLGEASLWIDPFHAEAGTEDLALVVDGVRQAGAPKVTTWDVQQTEADVNFYQISAAKEPVKKADIAFIVDATGSMGDEIAFLKKDLMNILDRVKGGQGDIELRTGAVFYRDEGDDYVTKYSQFTGDYRETIQYIAMQDARGGGDHPEAVHTALGAALQNLDWNASARSRIAFLILDAPAHQDRQGVVESLQASIESYAKYGIKIIPVFCSSPTKECEFMCRYFATLTGGTYVFLTDDSGVGGDHIEASVGQYQVEALNDLLVRLIAKYIG